MTTVVRIHNLIVADRKATNHRSASYVSKIRKTENDLWVPAGTAKLLQGGVDAILRDGNGAKFKAQGILLRFSKTGEIRSYTFNPLSGALRVTEISAQDILSIGSGAMIVESALALGYNIPDAYDLVFALDPHSGGGIDVYDLRTHEPVDPETLRC